MNSLKRAGATLLVVGTLAAGGISTASAATVAERVPASVSQAGVSQTPTAAAWCDHWWNHRWHRWCRDDDGDYGDYGYGGGGFGHGGGGFGHGGGHHGGGHRR
jgi:hypothetical protein